MSIKALNQLQAPVEALAFVVDFAQADIAALKPGQVEALDHQMMAFIYRESPGQWLSGRHLDLPHLHVMQQRAIRVLDDIVRRERVQFTIAGDLVLSFLCVRQGDRVRVEVLGSLLDRFLYQLVRVIDTAGLEKIRACPESKCGHRIFVRVTQKKYCGTTCQNRANVRTYREAERRMQLEALKEAQGVTARKK